MIEFFLAMVPPTTTYQMHQVKKVNGKRKPVFYEPEKVKAARNKLMAFLAIHKPEEPMLGGIRLIVKWCFPAGSHKPGSYRVTRPDTDNLQKLLKDCMTACGFWNDDAQVASEIVEKFWSDIPGIWIRVEELQE